MLNAEAWGKLKRDAAGQELGRLSLLGHSIDVAAVTAALLQMSTIRRRMGRLAKRELTPTDIDRLAVLAILHDMGKVNVGFQSKSLPEHERLALLRSAGLQYDDCGHTHIGLLFEDRDLLKRLHSVLPLAALDDWDALPMLKAAISHHGTPLTDSNWCTRVRAIWRAHGAYDPWHALAELGSAVQHLFPGAFMQGNAPLPEPPAFTHAFAGLVSLADWIASNAHEDFFPYNLADGVARWPVSLARAAKVLRRMRIDLESEQRELRARNLSFGDVFRDPVSGPYSPSPMQQAAEGTDFAELVVLEAETGSGKTEAALWRFKTLFERGEVDALAFVLPTRVSAVQIEQRVRTFVEALFPDPTTRPNVLLAVPGYLRVDGVDALERLPEFEVLWPDQASEGNAHRRWVAENTKRYLAAACAVGTIDQVLLSGLTVRHAHLRGFALLRSLLVVDEVHSSDIYMRELLRGVLRRHVSAGGHALLLSATLGVEARKELLGTSGSPSNAAEREATPYPCISDRHGSTAVGRSDYSKSVQVELQAWIDAPDAITRAAAQAVADGARVLVIRNTVAGVLSVQASLENLLGLDHPALFRCVGVVSPHHGRYAAEDRRLLDAAIESQFGKRAPMAPRVLCGTQTLEQSLDIDADLLITDIAPMDVLLQRIGRLHRHRRSRPRGYDTPRVIIVTPRERDLLRYLRGARNSHSFKLQRAYENVLAVDATWSQLEQRSVLSIPSQNRELVERTTDWQTLSAMAEARGGDWELRRQQLLGTDRARSIEAHYKSLNWNTPWEQAAYSDQTEAIRTRLGVDAVRLPVTEVLQTPFGCRLYELAVPAWMWRGPLPKDGEVAAIRGTSISIGLQTFTYDRLGLHTGTSTQT